jgi:PIN domain nuclease of toxin-antitoxin system
MLLDTHAAIWFARGIELSDQIDLHITNARNKDGAYLSAATVWELGNLIRKRRPSVDMSLADWVRSFHDLGGFRFISLSAEIMLEASELRTPFHSDPADRFLVATARHLAVPIITRDRRILAYAKAGHVRAVAC